MALTERRIDLAFCAPPHSAKPSCASRVSSMRSSYLWRSWKACGCGDTSWIRFCCWSAAIVAVTSTLLWTAEESARPASAMQWQYGVAIAS